MTLRARGIICEGYRLQRRRSCTARCRPRPARCAGRPSSIVQTVAAVHIAGGDLFEIRLRRSQGRERRAAYCAGLYDRQRRRIVSRRCGYLEGEGEGAIVAPSRGAGVSRLTTIREPTDAIRLE